MRRPIILFLALAIGVAIFVAALSPSMRLGISLLVAGTHAEFEKGKLVREIENTIRENSHSGKWGERIQIPPQLIANSLTKHEANINLMASKFELKKRISMQPWPNSQPELKIEEGVVIYLRRLNGVPCATILQIYLLFDGDRLVEASGAIFEAGCM
ncbi:MAG: hypothetical protein GXP04_07295 [Alphaproteobacteria bacterium]|nr:hypothetical protein [Alphaproteobacteria bacterium]